MSGACHNNMIHFISCIILGFHNIKYSIYVVVYKVFKNYMFYVLYYSEEVVLKLSKIWYIVPLGLDLSWLVHNLFRTFSQFFHEIVNDLFMKTYLWLVHDLFTTIFYFLLFILIFNVYMAWFSFMWHLSQMKRDISFSKTPSKSSENYQ